MPTKSWTKIIIGLFSAIILLVSVLTGQSIATHGLSWISGASSAVILLLVLYERWIWRWPLIRKLAETQGNPVIFGTWRGTLAYDRDGNGKAGSTDIYFSIYQTFSMVYVRGYVASSESHSLTAKIDNPLQNQRRLIFAYQSLAPHGKRDKNRPHDGTAILNIIGTPAESISGSYYTDRKGGTGSIKLSGHCSKLSESYEQAVGRYYKKLS